MTTIDGKLISENIYQKIKSDIAEFNLKPKLGIILASDNEASKMYINMKSKKAQELGISTELKIFTNETKIEEIAGAIKKFNEDKNINGILLQLPLYEDLEFFRHMLVNNINPLKDPDGLSAINLGLISQSVLNGIIPATVDAILECLKFVMGEPLSGKIIGLNVVIINNTDLIGKPLAAILSGLNATVTIANKFTEGLNEITKKADVIISATGQTDLIGADQIKKDAVLIDVTSIKKDGVIKGDFKVDEELKAKGGFLTPVPGGVGPLTIACLLRNLVNLTIMQNK